jgi:hypothetical protein
MKFEYAITVRSQPDLASDYGRALERVAFFPGVTEANLVAKDSGSITIGYNGKQPLTEHRKFCSDLEADGLIADCALWDAGCLFGGRGASNAIALFCRRTWGGHFQNKHQTPATARGSESASWTGLRLTPGASRERRAN